MKAAQYVLAKSVSANPRTRRRRCAHTSGGASGRETAWAHMAAKGGVGAHLPPARWAVHWG